MPKPKPLSSKRGEVRELTIADMKAGKPLHALQGPLKAKLKRIARRGRQ